MKNAFIVCFLSYLANSFHPAHGQELSTKELNPEKLIEDIFPAQQLDLNYEELYDNLLQQLTHPIDLNRVNAEELRALYILREDQVESLLAHRHQNGPFISVYELQSVAGFDSAVIARLKPIVKVMESGSRIDLSLWDRIRREEGYVISRYERTLETKAGFTKYVSPAAHYVGSPDKWLLRMRVSRPGDFSIGFTAEKDAGEAMAWRPARRQYGFDYYAFHAQLLNKGKIQNLVAGDFLAQFGQGLALGGGFGMGKGAETITAIRRSNLGFMPHTSVNESGYFRGGAISYELGKRWIWHNFISSVRRDGNVLQDTLQNENSLISSFTVTGYHRTPAELATRKQIGETNLGSVMEFRTESLTAGVLFHQTRFDALLRRAESLYNQFSFRGRENNNISVFLNFSRNNITFFSESTKTLGHGFAAVAGLLASLTPRLDLSLQFRQFRRDFISFYSNAVAESTQPQNEKGLYWGWRYSILSKSSVAGYLDLFEFPWLRYRSYAPGSGSEWLIRINHPFSKKVLFYFQVREESKTRNLSNSLRQYQTSTAVKRNFWINLDYETGAGFSFKTRAQFSSFTLGDHTTRGMALIQDVNLDLRHFTISTRYALFGTDDYDNRLYVYERDALMALSFPAYFGTGVRNYVLIHWNANPKVDVWVRWAHTRYTDREHVGSGSEMILGNAKNDLKLQLRVKF